MSAYAFRVHMDDVSLLVRVELSGNYQYPQDAAAEKADAWARANLPTYKDGGYTLCEGEVP